MWPEPNQKPFGAEQTSDGLIPWFDLGRMHELIALSFELRRGSSGHLSGTARSWIFRCEMAPNFGIRALVLDFDGLVLDTESCVYEAWRRIYLGFGHELPLDRWCGAIAVRFEPVRSPRGIAGSGRKSVWTPKKCTNIDGRTATRCSSTWNRCRE